MLTIKEDNVNIKRRKGYQLVKRRLTMREEKVNNKRREG